MKQLKALFFGLLALGIIMNGCKKDDNDDNDDNNNPTTFLNPVLMFNAAPNYIYQDDNIEEGTEVTIGLVGYQPDSTNLAKIEVYKAVNDGSSSLHEEIPLSGSACSKDYKITKSSDQKETFTFTLVNENDQDTSKTIVLNLKTNGLPAPVIAFKTGDPYVYTDGSYAEGEELLIGIEAFQTGGDLEKFFIYKDGVEQWSEFITDSVFSKDHTITKSSDEVENWVFVVTNEEGNADSASLIFTLEDGTPFAYENTADGAIFHHWGQYPGAYDLALNTIMSQSDPDAEKDMENTSENGEPYTATWKAGDGNTTTFIKAEDYDYENATVQSANAALAAGNPVSEITTEAVAGDVYIANLRGTDEPCVIYIEEVSLDDPLKAGTGYMYFKYKKTSEYAGSGK